MVSPQGEAAYDYQEQPSMKKLYHNESIKIVSPQYELSYVYQKHSSVKKLSDTGCIEMVSHQYESLYVYQNQCDFFITMDALIWFISSMNLHMVVKISLY